MARTIPSKIASDTQKLAYGTHVELFVIDTTPTGDTNGPYYICNSTTTSGAVVYFNSIAYTPIDYEFEGYEMDGTGKLARPTFAISNALKAFAALVNEYDGLVGTRITRLKTKAEFLDGGDEADTQAYYPVEYYTVYRVAEYNKYNIKWELAFTDLGEDKKLPGRQAWKNFCPYIYRIYIDGDFDYDNVYECPYTGSNYWKRDGSSTANPDEDVCGKRLSDCENRFPTGTVPFGGFPGMSAVRIR